MTNETFKTIPNREIALTDANVVEFAKENYDMALVFPITTGFDLQRITQDA